MQKNSPLETVERTSMDDTRIPQPGDAAPDLELLDSTGTLRSTQRCPLYPLA